ncbi:16S rRNA (uracil1498-N3)-methyltransferase [Virgibacillus subterraneus]|uniref:Ribosomal RNA small subunit methyltransferase E n=1 Tax=Virgibacillus subterraneus TaxID=621109 RepID=A0A1H9DVF7_9BACI|nr:16S rRNA (uracil1498-N3)-methyltransferase [Virgibacillus subterraneus]
MLSLQRYFVPETNWGKDEVIINADDAHHINRVMRLQAGDKIICNHPDGIAAICEITSSGNDGVQLVIMEWLEESSELPIEVTIAQGLPKSDKFELVLQKGTELGATAFTPIQAERSIVVWDDKKAEKKFKRYSKIVKEASEQSHRTKIPQINDVTTIEKLIEESSNYDKKLFAYEEEAKTSEFQSFGTIISEMDSGNRVLVCIGPEGGFSEKEADQLKQHGFTSVRLGPRILRTETASLYVLASISYQFEELRCR